MPTPGRRPYDPRNPVLLASAVLTGSREAGREIGADLSASLARSGIDRSQLEAPRGYLPFHKVVHFLNDVATRFDCPHFGLLVGQHQPPLRYGVLGKLIRLAPDIRTAFLTATEYNWLASEEALWELQRSDGYVHVIRRSRVSFSGPISQLHALSITLLFKAVMALSGGKATVAHVSFSHGEPRTGDLYRRFFKSPVYFDMDSDGIAMPEQCLDLQIATGDPELFPILKSQMDAIRAGYSADDDMATKVRHYISKNLGTTLCNLESVAQLLGQHSRTLQRELCLSGTTFRQLLRDARQAQAERYLLESNVSLASLSAYLGYRNVSAFSRAFKEHCGISPAEWRSRQRVSPSLR